MAVSAAFAAVAVAAGAAASSANQSSIANKRARNAQAAAKLAADEQTAALEALEEKPIPTGETDRRQRRRSISRQLQRRGRQSTILTDSDSRSGAGLGG